jgi:hypothetical protein
VRGNQWQQTTTRYDGLLPTDESDPMPIDAWWLQATAERLCIYATAVVPEVAQTQDYAEAIARQTVADGRQVDQIVSGLVAWQQRLDGKSPTRLTIVLDEHVLHRPVGGRVVLARQLEFLTSMLERPHVDVRVLPDQVGLHPGLDGAFTVCKPPDPYRRSR